MIKTTAVAILLLVSQTVLGASLSESITQLERQWAQIYYLSPEEQQEKEFTALLKTAEQLNQQYPEAAEPKIWQAVILSTRAAFQSPLDALSNLDKAKQLLEQSIQLDSHALKGSAYVTLGTLYFMAPGWPFSFGDTEKAQQLLTKALKINPNGIDSNYFYAKYLLSQDMEQEAQKYLEKALAAPIRPKQKFADLHLKHEVQSTLSESPSKSKLAALFSDHTGRSVKQQ